MTEILTKEYALEEVLGLTTGYLLRDNGFSALHEMMEWMAGSPVFTHQIPQVAPLCETELKKQFPQLDADAHPVLASEVQWLVAAIKKKNSVNEAIIWRRLKIRLGSSFHVAPLHPFSDVPEGDVPMESCNASSALANHNRIDIVEP